MANSKNIFSNQRMFAFASILALSTWSCTLATAQYAFGVALGKGSPISTTGFNNYNISDGDLPPAFLALNLAGKDFQFSPFTIGASLRIAGANYETNLIAVSLPIYVEAGFGSGKLPLRGDLGVAVKMGRDFSVEAVGAAGFQYLSISDITRAVVTGAPPFVTNGSNVVSGDRLNFVNQNLYYKLALKARYRLGEIVPFVQVGYTSTFGEAGTKIVNQTTGEEIRLTFFSAQPSVDFKGVFLQAGVEFLF